MAKLHIADTLNHLDGFRLSDYKLHGTTDYLENPLNYNRMSQETLTVMWETIQKINNHSSTF